MKRFGVGSSERGRVVRIFEHVIRFRFVRFCARLIRRVLICNLVLAAIIASSVLATHIWAASSPQRQEQLIIAAERYVQTPARMIQVYGVAPQAMDGMVRLIEALLVGTVDHAPERAAHRYWQGRLLMVLPGVYRRLGREDEALERGQRAIVAFEGLVVRDPTQLEYLRRLAISHDFQANALSRIGRHEDAIASWHRQHEVATQLLVLQPDHWRWRWYQAGAALGSSASHKALGRSSEALTTLEMARTLARRLCDGFPGEPDKCSILRRAERHVGTRPAAGQPG
jgi:tetratricopeptide (TPR) repeat protein